MAGPVQKPTAFLSQDHCLLTFWKRFRELGRDDVHLFIVPDRSLCVHGVPAYPDAGFATWLAYVLPARRAREFKSRAVASPTPSQAQLYPTILELLEGAPLSGSFALRCAASRNRPATRIAICRPSPATGWWSGRTASAPNTACAPPP